MTHYFKLPPFHMGEASRNFMIASLNTAEGRGPKWINIYFLCSFKITSLLKLVKIQKPFQKADLTISSNVNRLSLSKISKHFHPMYNWKMNVLQSVDIDWNRDKKWSLFLLLFLKTALRVSSRWDEVCSEKSTDTVNKNK